MTAETVNLPPLELWAGVECTVNRVGDTYSDQLERSGHAIRSKDLERLAELGRSHDSLSSSLGANGATKRWTISIGPGPMNEWILCGVWD